MRKGAFTIGSMTCSCNPVDMRGCQLVPGDSCNVCENFSKTLFVGSQLNAASSTGQPNGVSFSVLYCCGVIFSCDWRMTGSRPRSTNGASTTGPAMVM